MGLLDIIRAGISVANTLTTDLQVTVLHEAYITQDGRGKRTYAAGVNLGAIVEVKPRVIRSASGQTIVARASITILDASVIINEFDRLTLPDGTTGPILERAGVIDRVTGRPVTTQVFLG